MRSFVLLAALLAGCGASDPWLGVYAGTESGEGRDCETDVSAGPPVVRAERLTLSRNEMGRLFFHGLCNFTIDEPVGTVAAFDPVGCDTTRSDGAPLHTEVVTGTAELDGDELTIDLMLDVTSPTECLTVTYLFSGRRE